MLQIRYSAADSVNKSSIIKVGPVTSFLLTGLQRDTNYSVQVASYGDKRFLDSAPASTTVKTDYDGKEGEYLIQLEYDRSILHSGCANGIKFDPLSYFL